MKRRALFPAALALLASIAALAACARRKAESAPRTELEGYWVGGAVKEVPGKAALNVAGDRFHFQGPTRHEWYEGRFVLGPPGRVRTLELTVEEAEEDRGKSIRMLYRLDGDVLTLAATRPGAATGPISLEPGRGILLLRFRRAPGSAEPATSPASR